MLAHDAPSAYPLPFGGALEEVNRVQSGIAVPLINDGEVIGAISLDNVSDPQAFGEHDLAMLEAFAQTATLVIERVRTLSALQERLRQSEILVKMAGSIRANVSRDEILALSLSKMVDMFRLQVAVVFTPTPDDRFLQARHGSGQDWQQNTPMRLPMDASVGGRVFRTGQDEFINDIQSDDPRLPYRASNLLDGDSLAVLPLLDGKQVVGVFSLLRRRPFSQQERAMLQMTAEMLGNALTRTRLLEETQAYARRMASINDLGRLLAEAADLPTLYRLLLETVHDLLPDARPTLLWRWDAETETMRLVAGLDGEKVQLQTDPPACPLVDDCGRCRQEVLSLVQPTDLLPARDWPEAALPAEGTKLVCLLFGQPERSFGRGALQFWLGGDRVLSAREKELLDTVAGIVAAEIANSEYLQQSQRQAQHWTWLVEMAHALAACQNAEEIYRVVYDAIHRIFSCDTMMFCELDVRQQVFRPVFSVRAAQKEETARMETTPYRPEEETVSRSRAVARRSVLWQVEETAEGVRTTLFAPVMSGRQVRGVLSLFWPGRRTLAEHERQMIESIASQMAVTLRNHDLMQAQTYRMEQLQALHAVDIAITTSVDLDVALEVIVKETRRMLQADIVSLLSYDQALHQFVFHAGMGYRHPAFMDLTGLGANSPVFKTLATLQPLFAPLLGEVQLDDGMRARLAAEEIRAAAWLPLVSKGRFHGVLEICLRRPAEMSVDWREFALAMAGQMAIALDNFLLFEQLQESNSELRAAYDATIEGWALALEMRDRETEGHTRRVTELTVSLARRLGLSDEELMHIRRGALLHDIGKIGVPDAILHKPGKLTPEEWEIMRKHPEFAYHFLSRIAYLRPALDIPYSHHEKWDGSGYPLGLKGEDIPLAARIFAVADVYDALATDRPYRKAWPRDQVLRYIAEQAGKHFDPHIVAVFLEMMRERGAISSR